MIPRRCLKSTDIETSQTWKKDTTRLIQHRLLSSINNDGRTFNGKYSTSSSLILMITKNKILLSQSEI